MNPRGLTWRPMPVHDPRLPLAVVQVGRYERGRLLAWLSGGYALRR